MAKKKKAANGKVNVSEAIRSTWDADQSLKPAAIVEALKGKGIDVKAGTVATTLSQYRKKLGMPALRGKRRGKAAGTPGRRGRKPSNGSAAAGNTGVAKVLEALRLIKQATALVGVDGCRVLLAETEMGS